MFEQLYLGCQKKDDQDQKHEELLVELGVGVLCETDQAKGPVQEAEHIVDYGVH